MRSPIFEEIWTDKGWEKYDTNCRPARHRSYYQMRSCFRMALWIPLTIVTVYMFLSVVSVYS